MPTGLDQKPEIKQPLSKGRRLWPVLLLCCGLAAALCLWAVASARQSNAGPVPAPPPAQETPPASEPPRPTAPPEETVSAAPLYDFSQPAPEDGEAEEDYFSDAVFLGDSRTDGLRLYSGIRPGGVIYHNGLMVFEAADRENKCIKGADGQKHAVLELLEQNTYGKVYVMFGVNELGYFNDQAFADAYSQMVDDIRAIQPNAVIYLQNLVSVNPEKCKANNQPYYVTNEKIAVYNDIIADIAEEKHAVLVDVNAALVDETGILPAEGTTDGVHFTKDYYVKWYDYLKIHTVDPDLYWAGQTAVTEEGA